MLTCHEHVLFVIALMRENVLSDSSSDEKVETVSDLRI